MLRWLGVSALVVAAFVAFMATGSGRAAEQGAPAKPAAAKEPAPAKETAPVKNAASPELAGKGAAGVAATAGTDGKAGGDKSNKSGDGDKKTEKLAKTDKSEGAPKGEAEKTASAPQAAPGQARRTKPKHRHDGTGDDEPELPPGQGPPPPSPLTASDLRQEANRDRASGGDFNAPPRVKLEQLLAEVGKARQSLHDDTLKLESLAGSAGARDAEPTSGPPPAPGAPGQPVQKNPLDVLAKALRGIKPEQAAPIVARLDKGLAATVLLKMPPVDAGKIMGALKPEVAAELATHIALRAPAAPGGGKR